MGSRLGNRTANTGGQASTVCRIMNRHLLFLSLVFATFCSVGRAAVVELNLENLALRSGYIFCGEVVEVRCHRGKFLRLGEVIFTDVRIRVSETWKDTAGQPREITRQEKTGKITEITIRYLGGRIGDSWQKCAASPSFSSGEKVLVFARKFNGSLSTTGWFQGKYSLYQQGPKTPGNTFVGGGKHLPIRKNTSLEALRLQVGDILRRGKKPVTGGTEK